MTPLQTVAAIYVEEGGDYYGLPGVDPWPESRDPRLYPGPHPVVAHPPRWGRSRGEDRECFDDAVRSVACWGGVLVRSAYSDAWSEFFLPHPNRRGGWMPGRWGHSCHVEQGNYGHVARRATWLFVVGVPQSRLPELRWGQTRPRVGRVAAERTPPEFRDVLLALARAVV